MPNHTLTLPKNTSQQPDARRHRVAWQAQRLLSEAARQLDDLVRLSARHQQQTWQQALHAVEQVSEELAQVARPPQRSRRSHYSLDWRRKFAVLLRERREERGLSRQQLAERCKLSIGTIRNLETFRVNPDLDTIERLLSVEELGLSMDELERTEHHIVSPSVGLTRAPADLHDH